MDVDLLLSPVQGASPSGDELRNNGKFHAIERLLDVADKSVMLNPDGSVNSGAAPVAWQDVAAQGAELATQGRDLRLLVVLVRAAYGTDGFAGLAQGLDMLAQTLKQYWDSLHPALRDRPDAKMAALARNNALRDLENDDNGLLGDLRYAGLLTARGLGPVSGDDLATAALSEYEMLNRAASGLSQAERDALVAAHGQRVNRVTAATRAFAAEDPTGAQAMTQGLNACLAGVQALCAAFDTAAGLPEGQGLVLPELADFLQRAAAMLTAGQGFVTVPDAPDAATHTATMAPQPPGVIANRADVEQALDRIIDFYERTEPSSPLPHMARRMRRMVMMDFLELMEEVAPSGLKEFRSVAGVEDAKKK